MSRKILVTGAAGRIGSFFIAQFKDQYDFILTDMRAPAETYGFPFTESNITDAAALRDLAHGVDTIIHLAADIRTSAPWDSLLPNNFVGTYNVYEAARETGCRRVVFASTINVMTGYPEDQLNIRPDMPIRPGNLYGSSKAWAEAAGSMYADKHDLSVICLRFGWVIPRDPHVARLNPTLWNMVLTLPDCVQLIQRSVEAPDSLKFGIFHGVSDNREKRLDISTSREVLGFDPQDDGFALGEAGQQG